MSFARSFRRFPSILPITLSKSFVRTFADAPAAATMELTFALPYRTIFKAEQVHSVILPGIVGEYGVTAQHQPVLSELKPGMVQVFTAENSEAKKFVVSAGFAVTANSHSEKGASGTVTEVSVAEAVDVSELKEAAEIQKLLSSAREEMTSAANDKARAEAQIKVETLEAVCYALGVQPS